MLKEPGTNMYELRRLFYMTEEMKRFMEQLAKDEVLQKRLE